MSNSQMLFQFLGWGLLIWLHQRTLRKSELSRQKDLLVSKLDAFFDEMKLKIADQSHNNLEIEKYLSTYVSLLEFRFKQFNKLAKHDILCVSVLAKILGTDIGKLRDDKSAKLQLDELYSDTLEHIENSYHEAVYNIPFYLSFRLKLPELAGAFFGFSSLVMAYFIVKFLWGQI